MILMQATVWPVKLVNQPRSGRHWNSLEGRDAGPVLGHQGKEYFLASGHTPKRFPAKVLRLKL
jgi:hypothetical protein